MPTCSSDSASAPGREEEPTGNATSLPALRLVTGRPFDQLRPGGWTWLFEGRRHDEYALVAVADVAFTLTTRISRRG